MRESYQLWAHGVNRKETNGVILMIDFFAARQFAAKEFCSRRLRAERRRG